MPHFSWGHCCSCPPEHLTREHAAPPGGLCSQGTGDLYPLLLLLELSLCVLGCIHLSLTQRNHILHAAETETGVISLWLPPTVTSPCSEEDKHMQGTDGWNNKR